MSVVTAAPSAAWIAIGLVLSIASGAILVPYWLLFKPYRVKRLAYFLMDRWPWYGSWVYRLIVRRMTRATNKATETIGRDLLPALQKTTAAMVAWSESYAKDVS